jgi:hypothetical protein
MLRLYAQITRTAPARRGGKTYYSAVVRLGPPALSSGHTEDDLLAVQAINTTLVTATTVKPRPHWGSVVGEVIASARAFFTVPDREVKLEVYVPAFTDDVATPKPLVYTFIFVESEPTMEWNTPLPPGVMATRDFTIGDRAFMARGVYALTGSHPHDGLVDMRDHACGATHFAIPMIDFVIAVRDGRFIAATRQVVKHPESFAVEA